MILGEDEACHVLALACKLAMGRGSWCNCCTVNLVYDGQMGNMPCKQSQECPLSVIKILMVHFMIH